MAGQDREAPARVGQLLSKVRKMEKVLNKIKVNLEYAQIKQADHPSPYWDGRVGALKLAMVLIEKELGDE